jgi:23S rRNA (cytosine1962-C5)-methyltransferase
MAIPEVVVRLLPGREKALRQGHPWLFSGAIASVQGPPDAPLARVVANDGSALGVGFHSPRSQIRVRLLGRSAEVPDRSFFAARLAQAMALRADVVGADTTGYRVLNAEGDGVPGWTIDRYGDVLASQITVAGLEALRGQAYGALVEVFPRASILQLNDLAARRAEGLSLTNEVVAGAPAREVEFRESGLRLLADLGGQKTGFYCDQRENRRLVGRLAAGRSVLDLFAHAGACGLYALRGGATAITSVESAPALAERARRHLALNDLDPAAWAWVTADVFEDLRERSERYDLVVCDPPPLAKRRHDLDAAARAYKDVNRLALKRCLPGAFLLTFTCSGAMDATLFRQILFAAAVEAGVGLQLLAPLAAAPDHPVAVTHPQGEYLKGWWCRVGQ